MGAEAPWVGNSGLGAGLRGWAGARPRRGRPLSVWERRSLRPAPRWLDAVAIRLPLPPVPR